MAASTAGHFELEDSSANVAVPSGDAEGMFLADSEIFGFND